MARHVWVCVILAACGRVAFDARPAASDAGSDGSTTCAAWGPFSTPVELPGSVQSIGDDWFPTPTADELEIFFYSFRPPGLAASLWRATRPTVADPWGAGEFVVGPDTAMFEGFPTITDDGLVLMFARGDGTTPFDLIETRRALRTDPFDIGTVVPVVNSAVTDHAPFLDGAGLRLVFARFETFGELYEATRPSRAQPFTTPRKLTEIDAPAELDDAPTLSADGLELFWVSLRPGGAGGKDVWTARRPTVDDPFEPAQRVPELCSARDEYGLRLSRDGRTMYLNYDSVTAGSQDAQMFSATRSCL